MFLSILLGKIIILTSKILHFGAGGAWPGEVVLKLNKDFLRQMAKKLPQGIILISGTNGKTTTAYITASILREAGFKALHNLSGANLLNGIASSLIQDANVFGKLKSEIGIFEIDEANLPKALELFTPKIICLLNLSRDQLDRYGEVNITLEKWAEALKKLPTEVNLIINKDNQRIASLSENFKGKVYYFSLSDATNTPPPASPCSAWRAGLPPSKGGLLGKHNKLNALAAITTAKILNISEEKIIKAIQNFKPAFGRGEEFIINNRTIKILLAKNPASLSLNLNTIINELPDAKTLIFALNDNIPDGRDVSWIYDIEPALLNKACQDKKIFATGTRAFDMALRLKYADIKMPKESYSKNLKNVIQTAICQTAKNGLCLILPTYSAMLEARKVLCGRKIL